MSEYDFEFKIEGDFSEFLRRINEEQIKHFMHDDNVDFTLCHGNERREFTAVRHGRWKCKEVPCVYGKKFILTCSECGESVSVTELALPEEHYCRSCGARMEGVEHE